MTSTSGSPGEERAREDRYADVGGHGHTALASGYGECVPESVPYPTRGVGAGRWAPECGRPEVSGTCARVSSDEVVELGRT